MVGRAFLCVLAWTVVWAGPAGKAVTEKNVTVISAETSADGTSKIAKEIVEEFIVSLPSADELEPLVATKSQYLKHVNGKEEDNRHVKTYTAQVEIHYLVRQKELIIITTNSVQAQEPVIKEVERTIRKSETVVSDPNEGDLFANRSPREYFFTTAKGAAENARQRAQVWLKNHAHVVCPK
jgi:hypothetical protein